jgi:hypothetical protein
MSNTSKAVFCGFTSYAIKANPSLVNNYQLLAPAENNSILSPFVSIAQAPFFDRLVQYLGNRSVLKFVSEECLEIADESPDTSVTIDLILEAHREDLWWHSEAQAYIKAHDNVVQDVLPLL